MEYYDNEKYLSKTEHLLPPIVTDLENDGVNEIVLLSVDKQLQVLVLPNNTGPVGMRLPQLSVKWSVLLETTEPEDGRENRPVALEVGFIEELKEERQNRTQVRK